MVLEWLKGATGVFSAGDRGAARSPAQARPPARRVRIQEDAKAAAAARVTREKEKARKDTPRKKNLSRAPSSRLKDDFVVDKKVLGEGHYGVVRRCSPRADPSAPRKPRRAHGFEEEGRGAHRRGRPRPFQDDFLRGIQKAHAHGQLGGMYLPESPRFRPGRDLSGAPVPFRRVECVPKDTVAVRHF